MNSDRGLQIEGFGNDFAILMLAKFMLANMARREPKPMSWLANGRKLVERQVKNGIPGDALNDEEGLLAIEFALRAVETVFGGIRDGQRPVIGK